MRLKPRDIQRRALCLSTSLSLIIGIFGCTVDNPDFVEGSNTGGAITVGGTQAAGDQTAGDQVAGDQVAGDQVSGDQVAGDQVAGDQVAGDQVAGDQVAGDQVSGDQVAGDITPQDGDSDGYASPEDCDDTDPDIYPGQAERCDGRDQDCDGQVDESLDETCFALLQTVNAPSAVTSFGDQLFLVGDLDGDGYDDALVRGRRRDRVRLVALSSTGDELWAVNGDGDFARAIAHGDFLGDNSTQIIAADPENDRAVAYNERGQTTATFPINDGRVSSLVTLRREGSDLLAVGMPERYVSRGSSRTQGRIATLRFDPALGLSNPEVMYARNGDDLEEWGERMFNIGDLDGDGVDELIFTRVIFLEDRADIGTQLLSSVDGRTSADSLFFTFDETYSSFASALTSGRLAPDGALSFVFGAPLVSEGAPEGGGLYALSLRPEGIFEEEPLYGGRDFAELGGRLATLPRSDALTDLLIIGGRDEILYQDPSTREVGQLHSLEDIDAEDLTLGEGLAVSSEPGPDGTYRVWISGMSEEVGQSVIWIYSAR